MDGRTLLVLGVDSSRVSRRPQTTDAEERYAPLSPTYALEGRRVEADQAKGITVTQNQSPRRSWDSL